ncbi:hypothetical protein ACFTAO_28480 [Paenibacillus rhizoplanae]
MQQLLQLQLIANGPCLLPLTECRDGRESELQAFTPESAATLY